MMTFSELKEAVKKSPRDCSREEFTEIRRALRIVKSAAASASSMRGGAVVAKNYPAYSLGNDAVWSVLWSLIGGFNSPWCNGLFRASDRGSLKYEISHPDIKLLMWANSKGEPDRFKDLEDFQRKLRLSKEGK